MYFEMFLEISIQCILYNLLDNLNLALLVLINILLVFSKILIIRLIYVVFYIQYI